LVLTGVRGELRAVADALRHRRAPLVLSGSTVLIALNWLVYIYSVTHDRILESSLGVVWLAIGLGQLPWISLVLALSFGLYGLLRKIAAVGALIGLTVETLLLAPLAAGYLVCAEARGRAAFLSDRWGIDVLLLLAGP
jgi:chloramphenicol-sensitive protein RarD